MQNSTHILQQERPGFLDRLDSAPEIAFEEFYLFARKLLAVCPPQILWEVRPDVREDLVHDIVMSCCGDDFRVLRRYRAQGRPFSAWFSLVARNLILDRVRTRRGSEAIAVGSPEPDDRRAAVDAPPDRVADARVLLERVKSIVGELGDVCRILLFGAAEGFPPRDLVRLLGWPDDWNKKASDDLRECRRRLVRRLEAEGFEPGDLLEAR